MISVNLCKNVVRNLKLRKVKAFSQNAICPNSNAICPNSNFELDGI